MVVSACYLIISVNVKYVVVSDWYLVIIVNVKYVVVSAWYSVISAKYVVVSWSSIILDIFTAVLRNQSHLSLFGHSI